MREREEKTTPPPKSEPTETVLGDKVQPPPPPPANGEAETQVEPQVQPKPGLSAEELKQYNRAYANKDNFLGKRTD